MYEPCPLDWLESSWDSCEKVWVEKKRFCFSIFFHWRQEKFTRHFRSTLIFPVRFQFHTPFFSTENFARVWTAWVLTIFEPVECPLSFQQIGISHLIQDKHKYIGCGGPTFAANLSQLLLSDAKGNENSQIRTIEGWRKWCRLMRSRVIKSHHF